jgi:hypothetical protein
VWLAHDEHLDSPVAIKVLADNWAGDLHIHQRFVEEGRFLRKVESPHVVTVYDAGELEDDRPYLVMAYADQGTLADRLELTSLTPGETLAVIDQVGKGLTALHDRGVLHRDVKPANVLFRSVEDAHGPQVVAMVGDLGLGKAMDMSSRLTMVGGTPTYVAPEQARGEGLDARADQFSLAALSYVLLTGRQPFSHTSLSAAEDPAPPEPMGLDNPEAEAVVLRGLARDRDDRFPDVRSFTSALVAAMGGHVQDAPRTWVPVEPDPTREGSRGATTGYVDPRASASAPWWRRRRRPIAVAAALLALGVGAGTGWTLERTSTATREITDSTGTISVTVPESWTAQVDPEQWTPVEGQTSQPSLAAGTREGWNSETSPAPGVFVGILTADKLPSRVPQHEECTDAPSGLIRDQTQDGDESMTVFFSGCPGADVMVERVIQVNSSQLLWVQVRADLQGTARRVLASVTIPGI